MQIKREMTPADKQPTEMPTPSEQHAEMPTSSEQHAEMTSSSAQLDVDEKKPSPSCQQEQQIKRTRIADWAQDVYVKVAEINGAAQAKIRHLSVALDGQPEIVVSGKKARKDGAGLMPPKTGDQAYH